ncbi:MAG TPA: tetratricopeptide repeat protein [Candidatus Obscuribacterales bacterium]
MSRLSGAHTGSEGFYHEPEACTHAIVFTFCKGQDEFNGAFMKGLFSFLGPKKDAKYYVGTGDEQLEKGQLEQAEKLFAKALELAEESKDYDSEVIARFKLGAVAESQNRLAVAETHYNKAFRYFQDGEEWMQAADCLMRLGKICYRQRRLSEATQLFGYAQKYFEDEKADPALISQALDWLGTCCMEERNFAMAEKHLRSSIARAVEASSGDDTLISKWKRIGVCCAEQGKEVEAQEAFKSCLSIYEKKGDDVLHAEAIEVCSCLHEYGRLLLRGGKKEKAKDLLARAEKLCEAYPGYLQEAELADELAKLKS